MGGVLGACSFNYIHIFDGDFITDFDVENSLADFLKIHLPSLYAILQQISVLWYASLSLQAGRMSFMNTCVSQRGRCPCQRCTCIKGNLLYFSIDCVGVRVIIDVNGVAGNHSSILNK